MSDEVAGLDLLPLAFFTALVVYALAMGSTDLARTLIRIAALASVALCLVVWGFAALAYADWGAPVIDEFYATALLVRSLGAEHAGWLLLVLAALLLGLAMWEIRRRRASG